MLQIQTKSIDICRISKLLVKYNIKASITDSAITLEGDISEDLLSKLCNEINIIKVQNFISPESQETPEEDLSLEKKNAEYPEPKEDSELKEDPKPVEKSEDTKKEITLLPQPLPEYDLIYSTVKRGEIYKCDFGEPYGHEQGGERYALIVQNDIGNLHSPCTIVIACTTQCKSYKHNLPIHYHLKFDAESMVDYDIQKADIRLNMFLGEQVKTVDKTRLREYIGQLTPKYMEEIDKILRISLQLKAIEKIVEKKVYIEVPPKNSEKPKDINMNQINFLSFVDMNKLMKLSREYSPDEVKAEKLLKLFGFDINKNGVQYLLKAIISSPKKGYFNMETLCKEISKEENVDKDEVKRLIVARVKENFGIRKANTIDLIRLINIFL